MQGFIYPYFSLQHIHELVDGVYINVLCYAGDIALLVAPFWHEQQTLLTYVHKEYIPLHVNRKKFVVWYKFNSTKMRTVHISFKPCISKCITKACFFFIS